MELPFCHSRRDFDPENQLFRCAHPKVMSKNNVVSVLNCRNCSYDREPAPSEFRPLPVISPDRSSPCTYLGEQIDERACGSCRGNIRIKIFACDHPNHIETSFRDCKTCLDFEPPLKNDGIVTWSVGVTTSPRRKATLAGCLRSLARAGWDSPSIFAEPNSEIPTNVPKERITIRPQQMGAWPNWLMGLMELYLQNPHADAYLMVQDDVIFCKNLQSYLDTILWPAEKLGVISLANTDKRTSNSEGLRQFNSRMGIHNAWALVFPRSAVHSLLCDERALKHRLRGEISGRRSIDEAIGLWCQQRRMAAFRHFPSLVDTLPCESTVWIQGDLGRSREIVDFVGEEFDATKLISERDVASI